MQLTFLIKASLIASLITAGQSFAQNLPDEINHSQYLKVYQGLETVLNAKTAEYTKLAAEKAEIEKAIAQMEKDSVEIPARNAELHRLIDDKRSQVAQLENDIQGLEGVLGKIVEDLNRLDAVLGQLQGDLQAEGSRSQSIRVQRQNVAQDVAQRNARYQREAQDEEQSERMLGRLNGEMQSAAQNINEKEQDRRELVRENERFRRDVVAQKNQLGQTNQAISAKRAQAAQLQTIIPGIKNDIRAQEGKLPGIDAGLNPKKGKLSQLRAELASRQPEVTKLERENNELAGKIQNLRGKISATGLPAKQAQKVSLEKELERINAQIESLGTSIVQIKEAIKPELGRQLEAKQQLREAQRTRDQAAVRRLQQEIDSLERSLAPKRQEIARAEKQHETASLSVVPKTNELKAVTDAIPGLEAQVANMEKDITDADAKIKANQAVIAERAAANAGLIKEVADTEAAVNALEKERDVVEAALNNLRGQEGALTNQISGINAEAGRLEKDAAVLAGNVATMEKSIADFPMSMRRLEMNIQKLNELIAQKRGEASREERLLQRIRQDRASAERDLRAAQGTLAQVDQELDQSERLIRNFQGKAQEEQRNRDSLTRYNQESIGKLDGLRAQKSDASREIAEASKEIGINDQDIATLQVELPKKRMGLGLLNPRVATAETNMNNAQAKVDEANEQYQSRLSLYQEQLAAAQSLGSERAGVASTDGDKAGRVDAKIQAVKMATENAATHGKWEAMLRGYVRGEVDGYRSGFDVGMSSQSDATRGEQEGNVAGVRRAKDQAEHVMKPEFYLEEMDRRLKEVEVARREGKFSSSGEKPQLAGAQASASPVSVDIPELSADELNQSSNVVSALDAMIEQSSREIKEVLNRRTALGDPRNAYAILSAGANASSPNCSGVYKNVKDFVEACKSMYSSRYQLLFGSAHYNAFTAEYANTFKSQVDNTFNSEIGRLYPNYLKEATKVGKQVGIASGQKEIYRQSFDRSEKGAYAATIAVEEQRVSAESVELVNQFLAANAALALKGNAKLMSNSTFGISPGTQANLSMLVKNIGEVASRGDSVVKITEASSNVVLERREAPVSSIAAKSASEVGVMRIGLHENAVPGSRVVLAGQVIHPGNLYRANRVENFRIETVLRVNPSVTTTFEYDESPKVAGLFGGIKEHEVEVTVRPKFAGVNNYEVSLEAVGTDLIKVLTKPSQTGAVGKGAAKKVSFEYSMSKAAKGKSLSLKVVVKHEGREIESYLLKIQAK